MTTGWWHLLSLGPAWERNLLSPAVSGSPHLFIQLGWGTGMPLRSISWGNELAWGRKPGQGDDVLYRHAVLEVLDLSFESYLPRSTELQSRKSFWFHFSSFSSEIIKTLAAGRAGHMAGVYSA